MLTRSEQCRAQEHASADSSGKRALWKALVISIAFMCAEALGGYWTNSLVLLADAGHMLTDVMALALSLFAVWIASRPATPQKTFGFYRVEIFAALLNGVGLLAISLLIVYESYLRLKQPHPVHAFPMLVIAVLGLIANAACARILYSAHSHSLNIRSALLHVIGDALGSVAAIIAGICMAGWNWYIADPLTSLFVSFLITYGAWRLLKDSVDIMLEATPAHIDIGIMEKELAAVRGVASIHDLHVWSITSGMTSMSCHAVVCGERNRQELLAELKAALKNRFSIHHSTIQIEEEDQKGDEADSCKKANCAFDGAR